MLGKSPNQSQKNLFQPLLLDFINLDHELVLLSKEIDWSVFDEEFSDHYSETGAPAKPIRLMVGLLILKQIFDYGDETLMPAWVGNPYFQYFCGEAHFQWNIPCDPSDLVHFRKRIGEKGIEKILAQSIKVHGKDALSDEIVFDTTAQEKNITYPTDTKLRVKIIKKCNKIAIAEQVEQRRSYKREVKRLLITTRFSNHPKRKKEARKAAKRIKIIAGRLVRELERKIPQDRMWKYKPGLDLFNRVLSQKKEDKNKVYSLHEPDVACIAKGKAHKPYEFGSKVSLAITRNTNIIVAAVDFEGNPHDTKTIAPTLEQYERLTGQRAKIVIADRGYRGRKTVNGTQIVIPDSGQGKTGYEKTKSRKQFRRRAAIEPVISHMKHQYRMDRNYLSGKLGDKINVMMAAAAFNFKSRINKILHPLFWALEFIVLGAWGKLKFGLNSILFAQFGVVKD